MSTAVCPQRSVDLLDSDVDNDLENDLVGDAENDLVGDVDRDGAT